MSIETLSPQWPAPANIKAFMTLRSFGNCAGHVGDDPHIVAANRQKLQLQFSLPSNPYWLNQIHSDIVIELNESTPHTVVDADGSYTHLPGKVCVINTADCLPVLLCDEAGQQVAALHAGWKGLLANILDSGVKKFSGKREQILAWLGPAIGPQAFEVGPEVYTAFINAHPDNQQAFRTSAKEGHYFLDIYQLARLYLNRLGVVQIFGGDACTYSEPERFYSYRRENKTGRMATLIWFSLSS